MRKRDEIHRRAMQQYGGVDPTNPHWAPGQDTTRRSARSGIMDPADRATFSYTSEPTDLPPGIHPPPPLVEYATTLTVRSRKERDTGQFQPLPHCQSFLACSCISGTYFLCTSGTGNFHPTCPTTIFSSCLHFHNLIQAPPPLEPFSYNYSDPTSSSGDDYINRESSSTTFTTQVCICVGHLSARAHCVTCLCEPFRDLPVGTNCVTCLG
jgi:hypothetical protein